MIIEDAVLSTFGQNEVHIFWSHVAHACRIYILTWSWRPQVVFYMYKLQKKIAFCFFTETNSKYELFENESTRIWLMMWDAVLITFGQSDVHIAWSHNANACWISIITWSWRSQVTFSMNTLKICVDTAAENLFFFTGTSNKYAFSANESPRIWFMMWDAVLITFGKSDIHIAWSHVAHACRISILTWSWRSQVAFSVDIFKISVDTAEENLLLFFT